MISFFDDLKVEKKFINNKFFIHFLYFFPILAKKYLALPFTFLINSQQLLCTLTSYP